MAKTALRVVVDGSILRGINLADITLPVETSIFSDVNPPWRPRAGENIMDNIPSGATVVNASFYTTSRDMYTILNIIDKITTPTGPVYVRLDAGDYFINTLRNYGTATNPSWIGYANSNRKILGLIGAGFGTDGEFLTRIIASATMVSSSPDNCRTFVLNATAATSNPVTALYFSNTGTAVPLFFSGISFDGNLQGPFGVYSAASQAYFRRNQTVSSPLCWSGMSIWRAVNGSKFQFCRGRGFGFALNSAPPFEAGFVNSNYCNLDVYCVEVDGRVPAHLDPTRPRASGGWMQNKEIDLLSERVWQHHTRRSGMAINTNTHSTTENYKIKDCQLTDIANIDASDPYPSDASSIPGGFNTPNVEAVLGLIDIENLYANSVHSHVNYAIPNNDGTPYTLPARVILKVRNFSTTDSLVNGCLRVSTPKAPNSSGDSPLWTAINANMTTACALYFDIKNAAGTAMSPFKFSLFNSAVHTPDLYYCLRSF